MTEIEILFKSGASIRFHCIDFKVKTINGVLSGYEYTGAPPSEQVLHINITDVDCVRVVSRDDDE